MTGKARKIRGERETDRDTKEGEKERERGDRVAIEVGEERGSKKVES